MTSNPDLFNALATVAEADAAVLAQQGSLYKDYTLPGKYAKYNLPGVSATGSLPFGNYSSIFHNVLYCGAYGDGIHDDTAAINKCLNTACGEGCGSTSTRGSVVYFPPGTYLVSSPIIMEYNTQMIGNVLSLPVILAAPSFVGLGVISSDVYIPGGNGGEWYLDTDNFFRQVRNFVIDMTECTTPQVAGIHWQVAQATSLQNIEIVMDSSSTTTQVGIYSENGSGGFMSDILIAGGNIGLQCGNQQFTTRNFIFYNVIYGIWMIWDWGWTFKSITWDSVQHAIWMVSSTVGGSLHLLDSTMNSVTTNGIVMDNAVGSTMQEQVLITIDNLAVDSATIVVFDVNAGTFLSTSVADVIQSWVIGKQYDSYDPGGSWVNGATLQVLHPTTGSLMGGPNGGYFESSKPQYNSFITDNVLMANIIAVGDGETDDTASLSLIFEIGAALSQVVYIPTGSYIITSTLVVPVNSRISGSLWSQLVAKGDYFEDIESPQVMLQVGNAGDIGTLQLQDLLFTGVGPTAGAILVEWNVVASSPGTAGMWDCHFRVGGAVGTDLQVAQCPTTSTSAACIGAFLMFHVTSSGNGYFENVWAWSADHDMDDPNETQINVFTGRGTLIESPGPSWFYASASEHAVLYQYNLYSASSIYMGMIQSETPYYSPLNPSPGQFTQLASLTTDPDFSGCTNVSCEAAWALTITNSTSIQILGAGLYSWYNDGYSEACVDINMITPGPSDFGITGIATAGSHPLSGIVTATDNLVENAHPFLSALNAWTSIDTSW
ncbi:glycoside hydrolase family 55 protein [Oidiodendron maius Zn]|uniref:Glycoside hydrolase family 55 protein n=1 Tax=Oidiodendron maius (strain Zn) TaxID=913774 RepID=A0A0C3CHK0_OIDMZ|nr:glycoside hydrolase family 55 protein [Oidiodendron maius Zn]